MNVEQAIQKLRQVLRLQHKAWATESAYVYWLRRYINSIPHMPPALSSRQKVEFFLTRLACHNEVTASTQNQALNGILFFYKDVPDQPIQGVDALRAKRPPRVRYAPTLAHTHALLRAVTDLAPPRPSPPWPTNWPAFSGTSSNIRNHTTPPSGPRPKKKTARRKSNASKKTPPPSASNSSQTHELTSLVSYEANVTP